MMGGAKGRSAPRQREALKLAKGIHPKIEPQSDELPLIHLSHTVVSTTELETELLDCSGVRYRCFSYVYVDPQAIYWSPRALESYELNIKRGNGIMMDSGAFSFQMFLVRKGKSLRQTQELADKTLEQYMDFCRKKKKEWMWYATFDWDQNCQLVWDVTKKMKDGGLKPVPVYHGDDSLDWLKKYLDNGYTRLGISSLSRRRTNYKDTRFYLDQIFRTVEDYKVKLHGFAITSISLAYAYPWNSVDSSSWSRAASYGAIYALEPNKGSMTAQHVSLTGGLKASTKSLTELSPEALKSIRQQVDRNGWDFDLLRRSLQYRFIYNAWTFAHLNKWKEKFMDRYVRWEPII